MSFLPSYECPWVSRAFTNNKTTSSSSWPNSFYLSHRCIIYSKCSTKNFESLFYMLVFFLFVFLWFCFLFVRTVLLENGSLIFIFLWVLFLFCTILNVHFIKIRMTKEKRKKKKRKKSSIIFLSKVIIVTTLI